MKARPGHLEGTHRGTRLASPYSLMSPESSQEETLGRSVCERPRPLDAESGIWAQSFPSPTQVTLRVVEPP